MTPPTFVPPKGRIVVKCPTCNAPLCTISEEAVKRGMRLAGWSIMPVATALSSTLNLAALRCIGCEQSGTR